MKKNILYISPNFNLACGVSKHVFSLLSSEELKNNFNLFYITNGGDALFKLDQSGINYSIINFSTDNVIHIDFFSSIRKIKQICKENNIQLIHSHHRYPEFLSNVVRKSLKIKTVMTTHNFVSGFTHSSYKSDYIIAINNSVKDHLVNFFGINHDKINVLYNCIENEKRVIKNKDELKRSMGIPKDRFVILFLGRITKEKGIDTLINAFKLASAEIEPLFLIIVGSGDYYLNEIKNLTNLHIKKFPPSEEVQKFYSIADIVVLPSLKEPFGYTMLEAGVNKIPFIGSRTGGILEFIEDGVDGFLFVSGSAEDFAGKIKFVYGHPDEARDSAIKLNEKVIKLCNCDNYFEQLSNIYNKLLADL